MAAALAIAAGIVFRLLIWWNYTGCTDAHIWAGHAEHIHKHGLEHAYLNVGNFNHPPIMGWLSGLWFRLASEGVFDILLFSRWLKIPALLGEVIAMGLLWRFASRTAAAIYALSPVAILIAAFHGNTDALCSAFVLAGALAASRQRWFLVGAMFAAGINVKLIPLVLLPVLVLSTPAPMWPRLGAGLALSLVPFISPALSAFAAMKKNVLDYTPPFNGWGVMAFLGTANDLPHLRFLQSCGEWYSANGRAVVMLAIVGFALWARLRSRLGVVEQLAVAAALWLIFTPGFGIQYMIYVLPLLCVVSTRYALLWSIFAGAVLAIDYWAGLANPIPAGTSWVPPLVAAGPALLFAVIAWYVMIRYVATTLSPPVGPVGTLRQSA